MAKKIIDLVNEKKTALAGDSGAANEISRLAVAAIHDGVKSRAWETYMLQFVETNANGIPDPAQLSRLLAEDGTANDPDISRKRAYMVSNAVCGTGSPFTGGLAVSVVSIDNGLGVVVCDTKVCNIAGQAQPVNTNAGTTTTQPTDAQGSAGGGTNP